MSGLSFKGTKRDFDEYLYKLTHADLEDMQGDCKLRNAAEIAITACLERGDHSGIAGIARSLCRVLGDIERKIMHHIEHA